MKRFFRFTAAVLAAAFLFSLTGCGGSSSAASFTWFVDTIPTNLDPQAIRFALAIAISVTEVVTEQRG